MKEPTQPKQASLRRAISSAYYALFHLIVDDAARAVVPAMSPARLVDVVRRAFGHSEMNNVCKGLIAVNTAKQNGKQTGACPLSTQSVLSFPLDTSLLVVLDAFVELQEARQKADYDLSDEWNRDYVLEKIEMVREAFAAWDIVRDSPNAAVFMSALLLQKQWGR